MQSVTFQPDHDSWPAFSLPWDDGEAGPAHMGWLLEHRAGESGFVVVKEGHLARGDGRRWRIWGQNLCFGAPLPPSDMAPALAARLRKYGINCLRFHHMDHRWPKGVLMRSLSGGGEHPGDEQSTRALDPEAMARLDYFVYCLRENGIYTDLNLNVSRRFTRGDEVKEAEWLGYAKGLTYFDPRLIELQKEYARQLLRHVNPFTGNAYAEEPAVAIVEIVNENSLVETWIAGRLRGEQRETGGTWCDIPPGYAQDLDRMWNDYLLEKYGSTDALREAWGGDVREREDLTKGRVCRLLPGEFETASPERFREEALFYTGIEKRYFEDMATYLREDVGVRQVIIGSSDHNHGINNQAHVMANCVLDVIDGHCYWQHPRFPSTAWSKTDWTITNTPMVDAPDHSAIAQLSRSKVAGMPYVVTETNQPFPNDTACEFIPILAAYSCLQDWDGIFLFSYGGGSSAGDWTRGMIPSFFNLADDPVRMPQTAAGALIFLRGDVRPAELVVPRMLTLDWVCESLRSNKPDDQHPYCLPWIAGRLALTHRTEIAAFDADDVGPRLERPFDSAVTESDTGELTWRVENGEGRLLIDAPCHEAVIGRAGGMETSHLTVDLETPFASIQVCSLDGLPIEKSSRLLLLTSARAANTAMKWKDEARQSIGDQWGEAPTRIEPVVGEVALRGLKRFREGKVWGLDGRGLPRGEARLLPGGDSARVPLSPGDASPWHYLEFERPR